MPTAQRNVLPAGISASWLRAACPCPACVDPGSGQRLVNITDQPAEVRFGSVTEDGGSYVVTYEPDGHRAVLSKSWLAAVLAPVPASRTEDAKRLWSAADFASGPPQVSWDRYRADAAHRTSCLDALLTGGFVLLRDVPATPGMVLEVAASMGFVRETNYGKLFDVRAEVDPANLAFTSLAITPHTDNPYRDPVPTVQLLHCLTSAAEGGDSGLVDGFRAAGLLRDEDPAAFEVLTSTPVTFRYADATADLQATNADDRPRPARPDQGGPVQQPLPAAARVAGRRAGSRQCGRLLPRLSRLRAGPDQASAHADLPARAW